MKHFFRPNSFLFLLFAFLLVITGFFHKDSVSFKSPKELWSDRAGYYIYLPAVFFYGFDTRRMPADLDIATGGGFSIDTVKDKLETKYTYGVALMQSPFFLAAHLVSEITGFDDESGFSLIYMRMMMLATVVYLTLGLWLLYRTLRFLFSPVTSFSAVFLLFSATNLFYYSILDGMMSHVYSFFLFSVFLFSLFTYRTTRKSKYLILNLLVYSMAVLIRPTNILLGLLLLFRLDAGSGKDNPKTGIILNLKYTLAFTVLTLVLYLPQMAYWKYLSGHWLHFSYRDEGFKNITHPAVLQVLFSPVNGLFTYAPVMIFVLAGIVKMYFRDKWNSIIILLVFVLVTLVCASWSMWYFGCSYGQRSYIEYFAIFSIPVGILLDSLFRQKIFLVKMLVFTLMILMIYVNIRYITVYYRFERCWFGSTWDWEHYRRSFEKAGILPEIQPVNVHYNDFENLALFPPGKPSKIFTRSGQYSLDTRKTKRTPVLYSAHLFEFGYPYPKVLEAELWCQNLSANNPGVSLSFSAISHRKELLRDRLLLDSLKLIPRQWNLIRRQWVVPDVNDTAMIIAVFIENPRKRPVFLDDIKISFRYHWTAVAGK